MCLVDDTLTCRGSGSRTSRVATHNNRQIESPRTAFSIYVDIRNRTHKHADTGPPLESGELYQTMECEGSLRIRALSVRILTYKEFLWAYPSPLVKTQKKYLFLSPHLDSPSPQALPGGCLSVRSRSGHVLTDGQTSDRRTNFRQTDKLQTDGQTRQTDKLQTVVVESYEVVVAMFCHSQPPPSL